MILRIISPLLLVLAFVTLTQAKSFVNLDSVQLAQVKLALKNGSAAERTKLAYKHIIGIADMYLEIDNPSVMNKSILPPTGDRHDYLSLSRYWWPNPETKDSLPWIRKDGQTNPVTQTAKADRRSIGAMTSSMYYLSLAYYFSDNEVYAQKGISIIKTWFLDEDTRMNPHLTYAQSIPGRSKLRATGILDGRGISQKVLDAVTIFSTYKEWSVNDANQVDIWLNDYLIWLTQSDIGKAGAKQHNNHGSWYRYQVAALSFYLGNDELLQQVIQETKVSLEGQFDGEGAQTHEIARTKGFFYSCFNLSAITQIYVVAQKSGYPIWDYSSKNGKNIKLGIDYLIPFANGKEWTHSKYEVNYYLLNPMLYEYNKYIKTTEYTDLLQKILIELDTKGKLNNKEKNIHTYFSLFMPELFQN